MTDLEKRIYPMDVRVETRAEGEGDRIVGYAAVFNRDSEDLGSFTEEVAPGAFSDAIKDDDVRALVDHDSSRILGRTAAGTLKLAEDKVGLRMEIDLPDTTTGRDIKESIKRGDVTGASFSFRTIDDKWETRDGKDHRTLLKVKLFDVGPVSFPAYPDTAVGVRNLEIAMRSLEATKPKPVDPDPECDVDAELRQRHAEALSA